MSVHTRPEMAPQAVQTGHVTGRTAATQPITKQNEISVRKVSRGGHFELENQPQN